MGLFPGNKKLMMKAAVTTQVGNLRVIKLNVVFKLDQIVEAHELWKTICQKGN